MSSKASRYVVASAFALGTLFSVTGASAQVGESTRGQGGFDSMAQDLIGVWNNTSTGATGGYSIRVERNGDVWQQGAPMARVAETNRAGANFAFEGSYPAPDNRVFRCNYYITFLVGNTRASFRLVEQRGDAITCAQGIFERVAQN
jgi:hypothetical protein